jgi:hypothetical protein
MGRFREIRKNELSHGIYRHRAHVSLSIFKIAREAESAIFHKELFESLRYANLNIGDNVNSIAIAAVEASFHSVASAIIVLTTSG